VLSAVVATLLTVAITALASSAAAQDAAITLTLDDAIRRGLANSQRLAELQARQEAAAAVEAGRAAAALPQLGVAAGYMRTNHVDEFGISLPGQPPRVIYPDIPDNVRARLDLNWPVYSGGRTSALEQAARAERQATAEDLAAARSDLRLDITRAFWALVTAIDTERVVARSLDSMDAHVRDLRSRLEQGLIPPNELLSSQTQQSRQRVLAIEAGNTRLVCEADLRRVTGLDGDGRIEPAAVLEATMGVEPAPDALVAQARGDRPERRALEDRVQATRARAEAVHAAARPQVGLNGGYDYARPNPRIFPRVGEWRQSWDVSVNVSWTIWDGGRRLAEQAEAAAATRASEARAADFDRQATFEVRQRWLERESSRAAITAAADGVRSATEARRVVMERFQAGVATNTDVLDAELAVLQADLDRTRTLANARLAEARLERAIGR
jgi:outer membrane protein